MICTLDTATKTGWAIGAAGGTPNYGTADFSGGCTGQVVCGFRHFLAGVIVEFRPRVIVFESAYIPHGLVRNAMTLRRLYTLQGEVEAACWEAGIECYEARPSEISKFFLGTDRPIKREAKKLATIEMCRQYGWHPQDDNAADALALWAMTEAKLYPRIAARRGCGPLFLKSETPLGLVQSGASDHPMSGGSSNACQENIPAV